MSSALLKISSTNDFSTIGRIQLDKKNYLIGVPVIIDYIPDPSLPETSKYTAFFCLDPKSARDSSEMYFDISIDTSIPKSIKDDMRNYLSNGKDTIISMIQKQNPALFNKINDFCLANKKGKSREVEKSIIRAIIGNNEKPLALMGLPGYGKTTSLKNIFSSINSKNPEELSQRYNLSKEEGEKLKFYRHTKLIPINPQMTLADLMKQTTIAQNPKTGNTQLVYDNGVLLTIFKDILYNGGGAAVVFDEMADNPKLFTALKSAIMPVNGFMHFDSVTPRNFLTIAGKDGIDIKIDDKAYKRTVVMFEVGERCDGLYTIDDSAISVKNDSVFVDVNKMTNRQKELFLSSITNERTEKAKFVSVGEDDTIKNKNIYASQLVKSVAEGLVLPLISQEKAEEIRASLNSKNLKLISEAVPYAINENHFKLAITGNDNDANISNAEWDRFSVVRVDGISYDEMKENIAIRRFGIKSELFKKLDAISPDGAAVKEVVNETINLVKHIFDLQNKGELLKPEYDTSKEPDYKTSVLSSPTMNPRLITHIFNISSNIEDVIDGFKRYSAQILGVRGCPDSEEAAEMDIFCENIDKHSKKFAQVAAKYNIKTNLGKDSAAHIMSILTLPEMKFDEGGSIKITKQEEDNKIDSTPAKKTTMKI